MALNFTFVFSTATEAGSSLSVNRAGDRQDGRVDLIERFRSLGISTEADNQQGGRALGVPASQKLQSDTEAALPTKHKRHSKPKAGGTNASGGGGGGGVVGGGPTAAEMPAVSGATVGSRMGANGAKPQCRFWKGIEGSCRNGDLCRFDHY